MTIGAIIKQVIYDIYCHPKRFILFLLLPYSIIWTVLEPVIYFNPKIHLVGWYKFLLILFVSLIIALVKMKRSTQIDIKVPHSNTTIQLKFGDLFLESDCKVIPVNEFFDSKLGDHVAENSVHGVFINRILGGHENLFDKLVNSELEAMSYELVERKSGNNKKYSIGTTVNVQTHGSTYFLVALCRTDIKTLKAKAEVYELMLALQSLWSKARNCCNGKAISLPLIGGGLSNVDLTPNMLLRLIIISIIAETKKNKITETIRIILHQKYRENVNLDTIKEEFG